MSISLEVDQENQEATERLQWLQAVYTEAQHLLNLADAPTRKPPCAEYPQGQPLNLAGRILALLDAFTRVRAENRGLRRDLEERMRKNRPRKKLKKLKKRLRRLEAAHTVLRRSAADALDALNSTADPTDRTKHADELLRTALKANDGQ